MDDLSRTDDAGLDQIAVIGMSCRFAPDLDTPEALWAALVGGSPSPVTEMPRKRWEPYSATSPEATAILRRTIRLGRYLDDIEGFDAEHFGITPREADFLDPQQRIMLELAWESLERAGIPPLGLRGSEVGVFVAANSNDYGRRLLEDIPRTGAWAVNGTTYYGIANRISYALDLRGPSVAVDTACAGSLTALHYACQSLRLGETPVAIVGGINIMATPALNVALDAAGALAPDGLSKAFDKAADGYGRGEGGAVVVLKRLRDARRDGDPVLALVLGCGVFQDGRSEGMMAPNADAQAHMLRQVCDRAGVPTHTVDYVEAHGTGTIAGDLAEATALAAVYGAGRTAENPCLFGTVKPDIGHVEAASGIAGLVKTVLALRNGAIPASRHTEVNPALELDDSGLSLVAETTPWLRNGHPRRAGVSSYGVGGSIAHAILQEGPVVNERLATTPGARVYPVSAMSETGLRDQAGVLADWLTENPTPLADLGHTLSQRRSHLAWRGGIVAGSTPELIDGLRTIAAGERSPAVSVGRAAAGIARDVVWVFSGHGAQWTGMGRELLLAEPDFAAVLDRLGPVFEDELGWTPRAALMSDEPWSVSQIQALTFATQVALAEVWRCYGLEPAAVIGHSVGEIAAAVVAGALDLTEAARFACRRAAALEQVSGMGRMALVPLAFGDVRRRLADRPDSNRVAAAIAASPKSTVLSGDMAVVERVVADWERDGLAAKWVDSDVAFHSPGIEPALAEVAAAAAELQARTPRIPLYSTALADARANDPRHGDYWATNLREPVRFAQAVTAALHDGYRAFLEVATHPVVAHSIQETFDDLEVDDAVVTGTLRRRQPEVATLLANLATLHAHGARVDWDRHHTGGALADLPATTWQHRPYWIFPAEGAEHLGGGGHDPDQHTLLGGRSTVGGTAVKQVWQTYLDLECRPYPQDHMVAGVETVPASVVINSFITAATGDSETYPGITNLVLRTPVAPTPPRVVQIVQDQNSLQLTTRLAETDADEAWITHCTATVDPRPVFSQERLTDVATLRGRCPEEWTWLRVDTMFRNMGVEGYTFPWVVEEIRRNDVEQLAVITIEAPPSEHASSWTAVIDGALTASGVLVTTEDARRLRTSSRIDAIAFRGQPPARVYVHTTRAPSSPENTIDVLVASEDGYVVCEVKGLRFTPVQDKPGEVATPRELVHEVQWRPYSMPADPLVTIRTVGLVGGQVSSRLATLLAETGALCTRWLSADDMTEAELAALDVLIVSPEPILPDETPEQAAERCTWTLVRAAQRIGDLAHPPKLWCVTSGVRQAVSESVLAHAPLWGTSRIIAGERSDLWGGIVDLASLDDAERLLPLLWRPVDEDVFSVDSGVSVARLSQIDRPAEDNVGLRCRAGGTYLITGGLGGLGLEVARWLVERGARRLVLAGRRGLPARPEWAYVSDPVVRHQIEAIQALEGMGVTVRVLAVDIADATAVAAALDPVALDLPPVTGIVHAAGVVGDSLVDNVDLPTLRRVFTPKVRGAMILSRLFPPGTLDFFVLFSSCGQLVRLTGQTTYAAANSFLEGLAAYRNRGGFHDTTSLAWTSWQGVGMADTTSATVTLEANMRGMDGITSTEALQAWAFAERFPASYRAILRVLPPEPHTTRLPILSELAGDRSGQQETTTIIDSLATLAAAELLARVIEDVREQVAAELNLTADAVEPKRPLVELGVDSLLVVGLRIRLQRRYGIELPSTVLWGLPTVSALAGHMVETLQSRFAEAA
jgi:acyl transferase domain-containing protein/NAD(P)-dependent dehydrogenase (short-subunit alcohol dehydrogenase family)/acyl carrier protein